MGRCKIHTLRNRKTAGPAQLCGISCFFVIIVKKSKFKKKCNGLCNGKPAIIKVKESGNKLESVGKNMTDKELRRLKRVDLLKILIEQEKELEAARQEVKELKEELNSKKIQLENAGNIAEAALQANGFFEAAQKAAKQYLDNVQILSEQQEKKIMEQCAAMEEETRQKCILMEEEAKKKIKEQFNAEQRAEV